MGKGFSILNHPILGTPMTMEAPIWIDSRVVSHRWTSSAAWALASTWGLSDCCGWQRFPVLWAAPTEMAIWAAFESRRVLNEAWKPSGNLLHCYSLPWKITMLKKGIWSIDGPFSIPMLNIQRVFVIVYLRDRLKADIFYWWGWTSSTTSSFCVHEVARHVTHSHICHTWRTSHVQVYNLV